MTTIETPTTTVTYEVLTGSYGRRDRHIVFVGGQADPDIERPPYDGTGYTEAFGSRHPAGGIGPVHPGWAEHDKAWRRYNRAEIANMRAVAAAALGVAPSALRFSRRAGCTCPCSPGFLMDSGPTYLPGHATWVARKEAS